jgi:peroxiredoxin Q/BCP
MIRARINQENIIMMEKMSLKVSAWIGFLALGLMGAPQARAQAAATLKVGDTAPTFKAKTHAGAEFDLQSRKGHWTVLYFYPKSETPGCTKQACAFRDHIQKIRDQKAEVFGISVNTVKDQAGFHKHHHLNFTLLADPEGEVVKLYGTKAPVIKISKRWTFILDPELKIRAIEKDVDPAKDAEKVAALIAKLKHS